MRKRLLGLLAISAIVFAACQGATTSPAATGAASAPAPASAPPAASPTPVDYDQLLYGFKYEPTTGTPGGTAVIGEWQAANQLNYYFSNAFANTEVMVATMPSMLTVSADGHWFPWVSKSPITFKDSVKTDASGDGFTVHVEILPNLKWSDGETFSLNDMKYTWQAVLDKDQAGITTLGWENIDKIDVASDGLSADIHFPKPFAGWLGTVGGNVILPEHYMKTIPIKDWSAKSYPVSADIGKAVSMGPFKYSTATADSVALVRDDNWGGPAQACGGKACLDGVTYKFYTDNKEGEEAAFLTGEVDVALDLQQGDYDAIKGVTPDVGIALNAPAWEYEHLDMNQAGLGPGQGHPALKDLVVRTAIAQALDKKAYFETEFPGSPYIDNNPCTNATPSNYWQLPDAKCLPFDVAAAKAALDAAGYKAGTDGTRTMPDGTTPLVFEHCTSTAGYRQLGADFFAKSMDAIGIKVNENFVDSTTILFANWPDVKADTKCNLAHGNYDTSEFAYVLSFDIYGDYYYSYASEQIPTDANKGNGYNYLRLKNADIDSAIVTLTKAIAPKEQVEAAYKIQEAYVTNVPEVVIYYRNAVRGVSAKLQNFFQNPSTASDMWNIQDWWMKQ